MIVGFFALGGVLLSWLLMLFTNKQQFNRELKRDLFIKKVEAYKEIVKNLDFWETDSFDASIDYQKYSSICADNLKFRRAEIIKDFLLLSENLYFLFLKFVEDIGHSFIESPTQEEKKEILLNAAKKIRDFKTFFIEEARKEILD